MKIENVRYLVVKVIKDIETGKRTLKVEKAFKLKTAADKFAAKKNSLFITACTNVEYAVNKYGTNTMYKPEYA